MIFKTFFINFYRSVIILSNIAAIVVAISNSLLNTNFANLVSLSGLIGLVSFGYLISRRRKAVSVYSYWLPFLSNPITLFDKGVPEY